MFVCNKGLPHDGEFAKRSRIKLREDGCLEQNCSSSMPYKIANRAYKAHADWLNHFHSPWGFKGYKVESQNDQLRLI